MSLELSSLQSVRALNLAVLQSYVPNGFGLEEWNQVDVMREMFLGVSHLMEKLKSSSVPNFIVCSSCFVFLIM